MKLTSGQRVYWNERCDVDDESYVSSFAQLMGLQAVHIGNMIQSRRNNDMNGILSNWTKLVKLNDKWVCLVMSPFYRTSGVGQERLDRLKRVASDMSQGYTSTVAELILNGNVSPQKLDNVVDAEARFFSVVLGTPCKPHNVALGAPISFPTPSDMEAQTRRHWYLNTNSILALMRVSQPNVHMGEVYDDEAYHYAAAECIIHGKLLGQWLDAVFLGK